MALSNGQRYKYFELFTDAWAAHAKREGIDPKSRAAMEQWRHRVNVSATGHFSTKSMNRTSDFDDVMLELAITANHEGWIDRLSRSDERRIMFIIRFFIQDLEYLEKQKIEWNYVRGICKQMNLPEDIRNCPAELLRKVIAAIDIHIHRLMKRQGIEKHELPSVYIRKGMPEAQAVAKYRHDHHHHVHHEDVA
jgi:hypothetical protein